VKEANQAMTVRIKASKDIKRLTDERNAAMHVSTPKQIYIPRLTAAEKVNFISIGLLPSVLGW
jgi:hypothetical protein